MEKERTVVLIRMIEKKDKEQVDREEHGEDKKKREQERRKVQGKVRED